MSFCGITGEKRCRCGKETVKITAMEVDLASTMRKLWTDHGVYTKFVLNSIVDQTSDTAQLLPRLMANQTDIGEQLKCVVGDELGDALTRALKEHIRLAGDVMKAAVSGESKLLAISVDLLFANSRDVSTAISNLNPDKLPVVFVLAMFDEHNQFVIDMTTARIKGEYKREIELYDAYYNELLEMSDMIVAGLS